MDYLHRPIRNLLKGPLRSTPQGIACLLFSGIAAVMGVLALALPAALASAQPLSFGGALLMWPLLLFVVFIQQSSASFRPSWRATTLVSLFGLLPYVAPYWRGEL